MEQIPSNMDTCGRSSCLSILVRDIRIKGFLSFFFFCLQSFWNCVSQNLKAWSTPNKSYSNPEPVNQSSNGTQRGVTGARLCKEEVIMVMEKLGLSVELDGDGIGEFVGEQEIDQMLEKEDTTLAEVEEAFNVFDENQDGFIDSAELQRVLCCLGLERDMMQCQKMITAVDQNGEELIDRDEFIKFMERGVG